MTLTTADDFLALGESDTHMELIEGQIVVQSRPTFGHQAITVNVAIALRRWTEETPGSGYANIRVDHRIDDRNVYAPDVWWVQEGRVPTNDVASLVGPPDLAVEIRSASTWNHDVGSKKRVYERKGLPELWLVDTASESVLVYRRSIPTAAEFDIELEFFRGEELTSPHLPGFELEVAALFDV
jgi:Uma2 family endonuclease